MSLRYLYCVSENWRPAFNSNIRKRSLLTTLDSTKQVLNFCRFLNWKILMIQKQHLPHAYQDSHDTKYGWLKFFFTVFSATGWSNAILLKIWMYYILQLMICELLAFCTGEWDLPSFGLWTLKLKPKPCLEMWGTRQSVTRCHIPEERRLGTYNLPQTYQSNSPVLVKALRCLRFNFSTALLSKKQM